MAAPDPDAVARLVHAERMADSLVRERPFLVEPWERRTDEQRDMDRRIAAAVAAAERGRLLAELAARKVTLTRPGLGHKAVETTDVVPWQALEDILGGLPTTGQKERSDEKGTQ